MKLRGIKRLFRFPTRTREDVRDDIREEFQFHLDMRAEVLRGDGLDDAAARAQARREFGDRRTGEESCTGIRVRASSGRRRLVRSSKRCARTSCSD